MGYKIEYSPEHKKKYPTDSMLRRGRKYGIIIAVAGLLLCVSVSKLRSGFVQMLIPGDDDVTKASFAIMMEKLQEGSPLIDAVTAFCQEILNDGKV